MKLLRGETLATRLRGTPSISIAEGVAILRQMAAGLIAIHAAGFIQGFGGPMQTVGYMDGFIKVV